MYPLPPNIKQPRLTLLQIHHNINSSDRSFSTLLSRKRCLLKNHKDPREQEGWATACCPEPHLRSYWHTPTLDTQNILDSESIWSWNVPQEASVSILFGILSWVRPSRALYPVVAMTKVRQSGEEGEGKGAGLQNTTISWKPQISNTCIAAAFIPPLTLEKNIFRYTKRRHALGQSVLVNSHSACAA